MVSNKHNNDNATTSKLRTTSNKNTTQSSKALAAQGKAEASKSKPASKQEQKKKQQATDREKSREASNKKVARRVLDTCWRDSLLSTNWLFLNYICGAVLYCRTRSIDNSTYSTDGRILINNKQKTQQKAW